MRRIHTLSAVAGTAALTAALTVVAAPAQAATSVGCGTTRTADLITAIQNANSGGGTINLFPGCTYPLTARYGTTYDGLPPVGANIVINGNGATITRSTGSPNFRIFEVTGSGHLTLNALTVAGGNAIGDPGPLFGRGGGINDAGVLTLNATTVRGNTADDGGGISTQGRATASLTASTVTGNTAGSGGGGLALNGTSTTLGNSFVTANTASYGGGVFNRAGALTFSGLTVSGNTAAAAGGGLLNVAATATGSSSVIRNNTATGIGSSSLSGGGGIFNALGTVSLTNATVNGNMTTTANTPAGGIKNFGTTHLTNTAVTGNTAAAAPGGIYNNTGNTVTLTASAVFFNHPTNCTGSPAPVPGCFN